MTAREHDPALVEKAAQAHYEAWSLNAAERNGWSDVPAHNLGMTMAVLDAVADDIARAERERVLTEVEGAIIAAAPPINSELLYDGREDPVAAAYIEGFKDAWQTVSNLRGGEGT